MVKGIVINPTRIKVKGGLKAQKEFRESCADELREVFTYKKYTYISTEEMQNFYNQRFPELNINIKNERQKFPIKGLAVQNYNLNNLEMTDCDIKVASNSPFDKISEFFGFKSNRDKFYVDESFAEVFLHESTHMWQHFMKPSYGVFIKTLDKIFQGDRVKLKQTIKESDLLYNSVVYNDSLIPYGQNRFKNMLTSGLDKISSGDDRIKLASLKTMIRDLENEKEAYEVCKTKLQYFKHPEMLGNKYYDNYVENDCSVKLEARFDFSTKLRVMKSEYFELINKLRSKTN